MWMADTHVISALREKRAKASCPATKRPGSRRVDRNREISARRKGRPRPLRRPSAVYRPSLWMKPVYGRMVGPRPSAETGRRRRKDPIESVVAARPGPLRPFQAIISPRLGAAEGIWTGFSASGIVEAGKWL